MSERAPAPAAGFEAAETFAATAGADPFQPMLLVLFAFGTLVSGCLLGALRLGMVGWALAAVVSAGVCLGWYRLRREAFLAPAVLEASSAGLTAAGPHVRIELAWPDLRAIRVSPFGTQEVLVGNATVTVEAHAPAPLRLYLRLAGLGGTPLRLARFDPDWRTGRIGEWIRAYRPDLR